MNARPTDYHKTRCLIMRKHPGGQYGCVVFAANFAIYSILDRVFAGSIQLNTVSDGHHTTTLARGIKIMSYQKNSNNVM